MISSSITLMLDQARGEFGLQADVLDVNLASVLGPDSQHRIAVRGRPELTTAALGVVREGRAAEVMVGERLYRLFPLRKARTTVGLLVVEIGSPQAVDGPQERLFAGFIELLRSAIEADLAAWHDVHAERQQNRTLVGILRFLRYVLLAGTEEEVAEAVTHAAAVWFDVDPRVYRREPTGDYVLFSSLPAADISPGAERLAGLNFSADVVVVRLSSLGELQAIGPAQEGLLVPARGAHSVDWLLALLGNVPVEAELTLGIVARVVGAQMERLAMRRGADLRCHFEDIVTQRDRPPELRAVETMRQLLWMTNGAGAAVWIRTASGMRRIALVGHTIHDPDDGFKSEHVSSGERYVRTISEASAVVARLELIAGADAPFTPAAGPVVEACVEVLRVWLAGSVSTGLVRAVDADSLSGFVRRIQEELARARRFDRRFALLLVQTGVGSEHADLQDLVDLLRRELRESDLLGTLGHGRIVAVLVETDANAVTAVVRRVRSRLGEAATSKGLPDLVVGEAAFSEECTTVDALLTRAQVNAQTYSNSV